MKWFPNLKLQAVKSLKSVPISLLHGEKKVNAVNNLLLGRVESSSSLKTESKNSIPSPPKFPAKSKIAQRATYSVECAQAQTPSFYLKRASTWHFTKVY